VKKYATLSDQMATRIWRKKATAPHESALGMAAPKLSPPTALRPDHLFDEFDSVVPVLDDWLRRRALNNQVSGASRTYVVCNERVRHCLTINPLFSGADAN
jgi:hypothetical protein